MITGKTKSGFKFEVDERILSDWRFTSALVKTQKGSDLEKLEAVNGLVELLVGKDMGKLVEHIQKDNDGFAPTDKIMAEVSDIIESLKHTKN